MSFWGELKRRNVFKVGAAYVIVAWLIVQVASTFFPIFHIPDWAVTLVAFLLILGLPVALILAWAYEMTPEGVKLTKKVPLSESITHITGRRLNYVLAGLLVLAVALLIFDNYYLDRRVVEPEVASTDAEQTLATTDKKEQQKTIAVLPFADLSPEKDQEYFVDGLSEEILNSLTKIQDLRVIARTSSFAFKETDKKIQEIANELGANHILEGSVRKAGDALRITTQLIQATDGTHLWSETYNRKFEDIFAVQEDIATTVANELKIKLGVGKTFLQLGGTDNMEAYELFLVAKGKGQSGAIQIGTEALPTADAAIALDPGFAIAWALKAQFHNILSIWVFSDLVFSERNAAEEAALKAIELEPDLADGYFPLGVIKQSNGKWIEAELLFRKGMERTPVSINPEEYGMPDRYWAVGYFLKSQKILEAIIENDPLNKDRRSNYVWMFSFLGDIQRAEKEYERGEALFGSNWNDDTMFLSQVCAGKDVSLKEIIEFAWIVSYSSEAKEYLVSVSPEDFIARYRQKYAEEVKERFGSPEDMLAWFRQIYAEKDGISSGSFCFMSLFAAYFGDPDFALDAMKRGVGLQAQGIFWAWAPVMHEVRQLPKFKEFVREIGLVDYWNQFGWPDICHKLDNGDFECD